MASTIGAAANCKRSGAGGAKRFVDGTLCHDGNRCSGWFFLACHCHGSMCLIWLAISSAKAFWRTPSLDDARAYIANGPIASYEKHGFGLLLVELKESGTAIGICGLLKRDILPEPDIGYALLPEFWSQGYAHESATAVLHNARNVLGLNRILAVVNPDNASSIRLLERMRFQFDRMVRLTEDAAEVKLFALTSMQPASSSSQ